MRSKTQSVHRTNQLSNFLSASCKGKHTFASSKKILHNAVCLCIVFTFLKDPTKSYSLEMSSTPQCVWPPGPIYRLPTATAGKHQGRVSRQPNTRESVKGCVTQAGSIRRNEPGHMDREVELLRKQMPLNLGQIIWNAGKL